MTDSVFVTLDRRVNGQKMPITWPGDYPIYFFRIDGKEWFSSDNEGECVIAEPHGVRWTDCDPINSSRSSMDWSPDVPEATGSSYIPPSRWREKVGWVD